MSLYGGLCLCWSCGVCVIRLLCCNCRAWSCLVFGGFFFEKLGSSIEEDHTVRAYINT